MSTTYYNATKSGNWDDPTIWDTMPGNTVSIHNTMNIENGATVTIPKGLIVTLDNAYVQIISGALIVDGVLNINIYTNASQTSVISAGSGNIQVNEGATLNIISKTQPHSGYYSVTGIGMSRGNFINKGTLNITSSTKSGSGWGILIQSDSGTIFENSGVITTSCEENPSEGLGPATAIGMRGGAFINKTSGTIKIGNSESVGSSIDIQSGVNLQNQGSIINSGQISNQGSITNSGDLTFNYPGATYEGNTITGTNTSVFLSGIIAGTTPLELSSVSKTFEIKDTLIINKGSALIISNGETLTNNGSLINNGTIIVEPGGTVNGRAGKVVSTPIITSFLPPTVVPDMWIEIAGTGLLESGKVIFTGGKEVPFYTVVSDTKAYVKVPDGAKTGAITVECFGVSSRPSGDQLTVATPPLITPIPKPVFPPSSSDSLSEINELLEESTDTIPTITSFKPNAVGRQGLLTIIGTNFTANGLVKFNGGASVAFESGSSATKASVRVPAKAITGSITIESNGQLSLPSSEELIIIPNTMTINNTSHANSKGGSSFNGFVSTTPLKETILFQLNNPGNMHDHGGQWKPGGYFPTPPQAALITGLSTAPTQANDPNGSIRLVAVGAAPLTSYPDPKNPGHTQDGFPGRTPFDGANNPLYYSKNGGVSWNSFSPPSTPSTNLLVESYQGVAEYGNAKLIAFGQGVLGDTYGIFFTESNDAGKTWSDGQMFVEIPMRDNRVSASIASKIVTNGTNVYYFCDGVGISEIGCYLCKPGTTPSKLPNFENYLSATIGGNNVSVPVVLTGAAASENRLIAFFAGSVSIGGSNHYLYWKSESQINSDGTLGSPFLSPIPTSGTAGQNFASLNGVWAPIAVAFNSTVSRFLAVSNNGGIWDRDDLNQNTSPTPNPSASTGWKLVKAASISPTFNKTNDLHELLVNADKRVFFISGIDKIAITLTY